MLLDIRAGWMVALVVLLGIAGGLSLAGLQLVRVGLPGRAAAHAVVTAGLASVVACCATAVAILVAFSGARPATAQSKSISHMKHLSGSGRGAGIGQKQKRTSPAIFAI